MSAYNVTLLKKQKGFTALELIIVLIVGFSIIALSASKMSQLFSSSASNEAISSVLGIYSSARAMKTSNGYGADGSDLLASMIKAGTLPKNLGADEAAGTAVNEFGGDIKVESANGGKGFEIVYPNVPTESCVQIAQQTLHSGSFSKVSTASEDLTRNSTIDEITDACASDSDEGVEMTLGVNTTK
jgi:type II secretory pathway pseudopilin PulG